MESLGDILRRVTPKRTSAGGADLDLESEGQQDEFCAICKGLGWVVNEARVGHADFGKAKPCNCQQNLSEVERTRRLQKYSNLGLLTRYNFGNLGQQGSPSEFDKQLSDAITAAYAYAESPTGWFILVGSSGTGKTHMAAAIANYCLEQGRPTFFISIPDLLDHLRATYGPQSDVTYDDLFEQVKNAPILVLDDLGTQSATPWAQEKLYQLLNHRMLAELPTVVTLACPLEALDERLRTRFTHTQMSQLHNLGASAGATTLANLGQPEKEMLDRMTFESFDLRGAPGTDGTGREALGEAHRFARNFARDPHEWAVFTGPPGCGKTHLAVAISGECLRRGETVTFVMVPDLLDHLRYTFSPQSPVTYDQLFEQVKRSPLLILDDLGAEAGTRWAQEKLYQIIAHRYNTRLPTIITTNIQRFDDLPPPIASRLMDPSLVVLLPIAAPDYRPKEKGRYRRTTPSPASSPKKSQ